MGLLAALRHAFLWLDVARDLLFQRWTVRRLRRKGPRDVCGDVTGQRIVVTGPTSGIGVEIACALAAKGAKVILACRSRERGEAVKQRIEGEAEAEGRRAPEVEVAELDVGSLRSVKGFAERLRAQGEELDALVNNAGVFAMGKRRQETEEGVELHWATNYLGPAALTLRLLPSIKRGGRVVFVSSRLEQLGKVRPSDPQFRQKGSYSSFAAYCQSKLVEELFANELASRVGSAQRLLTLTVHPGSVATSVVRDLPAFIKHAYYRFVSRILLTPSEGARAPLHCATSEEVGLACDDMGRGSFESSGDPVPLRSEARDPALSRRVWDMLLGQAKLDDPLPLFPEKG